ncbi:MAG: M23 family metallopeptidase [Spirochaetia bacterium]|nr:M23 family metallopeptidase [Spirochaetia bacterium]
MIWKKQNINKSVNTKHEKPGNIVSVLNKLKSGILFYSYKKNGTLKIQSLKIRNLPKEFFQYFVNNLVMFFSVVPIVFALILLLSLSSKQKSAQGARDLGVGGIGELATANHNAHDEAKSEADEALKDKLLGVDDSASFTKNKNEDQALFKRVYKVKEGDNLTGISKKFDVSIEAIAGSSGIRMIDSLQVGQTLQIPSREGFYYALKKGERLASVISRYNVPSEKFIQANSNIGNDLLEAGDEVFLPDAKPDDLIRSWLIPVVSHYITSGYGWRNYPVRAFHKGLDFMANYQQVRAAKSGRVTYAGWLGGYGNAIVVMHEDGYKSLYGHLSQIYVKPGARVMQGSVIAQSGNTGYSTGAHLHFEITQYGRNINPATVLTGLRYYSR